MNKEVRDTISLVTTIYQPLKSTPLLHKLHVRMCLMHSNPPNCSENCWPQLLAQFQEPLAMMTSSNGNIFRVTSPLWGESTGQRWIPLTKASDSELWYFLRLNKWLSKQSIRRWFETPSCSLWWRHCNCNKIWLISLTLLIHKMCCAPNEAPNVSFFSLTVRD